MGPRLLALTALRAACGESSSPPATAPEPSSYTATLDVSSLIRQLGADETFDADEAAEHLAGLGDAVIPTLEAALAKEGTPVRLGVIEALAQIESARALDVVARVARSDPEPEVRGTAILALGQSGNASVRPALEAALDDRSLMASGTAAVVCGGICTSPEAIARMVDIALETLPETEVARMRVSFMRLLDGPDQQAARFARDRLTALGATALDRSTPLDRRARAAVFGMQAGVPGLEPVLVEAVTSTANTGIRTAALEALASMGTAAAVPALTKVLDDPQAAVAAVAALQAIARRGVPEAATALGNVAARNPTAAR